MSADAFANGLARHGDRPALVTPAGRISYLDLDDLVTGAVERLGPERRLVALAAANHLDAVVLYLAALRGSHPVILVDAGNEGALRTVVETYDPDVVCAPTPDAPTSWQIQERRQRTRHDLHPDLALLLSTSGSTGSPKLVRLSRANLESNAESIASYLGIQPDDRAITSLPMSYCYGLSVINSHLLRGASVVLTDGSVIDPEFWNLFRRTRATSLAGVPYTFELLDRVGFADMALPHLRFVTQAGGRLDPDTVRRYAQLGTRRGWRLYVMYGQTEATARMAYLPPRLASHRPGTIGRAIPGGSLRLEPVPDAPGDVGELVYRGPNVMLGYAEGPADLSLGRTVDELRTGDLARLGEDGLFEIVGRRSEFLKIAGLRVDPHGIERLVERHGGTACVVGTDDRLVVFADATAPDGLHELIRRKVCLPAHSVRVIRLAELPRRANGKVDRATLRELATIEDPPTSAAPSRLDPATAIRELYASSLARPNVRDDDTFSSLGGDSLSYVEVTLGLEEILGELPTGWETTAVRELAARASVPERRAPESRGRQSSPPSRWRAIEMTVALRAVAILLIVATHVGMTSLAGGAHVLMAVAGFNFGRFRMTAAGRGERVRSQLRSLARIAIPAMVWVATVMVLLGEYELRHLLLINALVQDELWGNLWFIELLVYIGLMLAVVLALPLFDRVERRRPFATAMAVLAVGLLFRFEVLDFGVPYTMPVLWLFALGWAASKADQPWQRALIVGVAAASVPGYFDAWTRNAVILAGILLLVGIPRVVLPRRMAPIVAALAAASLYIYLVHWEIWPMFAGWYGVPSLLASLGAGIGLWWATARATRRAGELWRVAREWSRRAGANGSTAGWPAWPGREARRHQSRPEFR